MARLAAVLLLLCPCPALAAAAGVLCDTTRTTTGLGDRLLNALGACVLGRLRGLDTVSLWRANTRRDPERAYNRQLLATPRGCALAERLHGATCALELHLDASQYGNFAADGVYAALGGGDGGGNASLAAVRRVWAATARELRLRPDLRGLVPRTLRGAVGVHLRLGDKVVPGANSTWQADPAEAAELRLRALRHLGASFREHDRSRRTPPPPPVFVVSDDPAAAAAFEAAVEAAGGRVLRPPPPPPYAVSGLAAVVDLFRLAACDRILMVSKFSSFSLAAALVGARPLRVFLRAEESQAALWEGVARLQFGP